VIRSAVYWPCRFIGRRCAGPVAGPHVAEAQRAVERRFPQHVYDRGGRKDMTAASDAVRKVYDPRWHDKLTRFLPQARRSESDDDGEQDEISGDEGAPAIEGS
jgi:hypothetical protein